MKRSDHILILTRALLGSSENNFRNTLAVVKGIYELAESRTPNAVSVGIITTHEQGLDSGVINLRNGHIQEIKFFYAAIEQNLEPHIAAAFAGSPDLLMQVKTEKGLHTFRLETYFSPAYQINPQQFILVLNAQPNRQLAWKRVSELVLESNRSNDRRLFDPTEIVPYLESPEGKNVFEFLAADLLKEVQIECSIHNQPFIIPAPQQSLFIKYPPLGFDDDREYVYLYPLRDVSAEEILNLAEAQSFEPEVWNELNKTLDEWQDETMKSMPVAQWKGKIMSYDNEMLQRIVSPVCRSICKLCEERKLKPVIPGKLIAAFGPNEEDQKRAAARSKGEKDRWSLQPTEQPWEYYAFRELDYGIDIQGSAEQAQPVFINALKDIRDFARNIQSPFEEAFSLALFMITDAKDLVPERLELQLKASGFSERAVEVLKDQFWIAEQFQDLGFTASEIKGMMAISLADVFGGMGSWNDQYVEGDQERYQVVSARMFPALKDYFASVISYKKNY